jgi:hypothetical protein
VTKRHLYIAVGFLLLYAAMFLGAVAFLYAAESPKPPVVSDDLRADFFKAQSELLQAQASMQQAQGAMSTVIENLNKVCGDKYQLQLDAAKNPACIAKIPVVNASPASEKKPSLAPAPPSSPAHK